MATTTQAPDRYDAIIIGTGQAGKPLAVALAEAGWKTAIIERKHVGGTCINVGCTPTKTMVASARVAYLTRRGADYGVHTNSVRVNIAEVRQRKQAIVDSFRNGSQRHLQSTKNLELIFGDASFSGPKSVTVRAPSGETRHLTAETIFINTGGRPESPPLPGLDSVSFLDSTSIMELDVLPNHLLVLGGGYIGLEFGQMFRRLGAPSRSSSAANSCSPARTRMWPRKSPRSSAKTASRYCWRRRPFASRRAVAGPSD